MKIVAINSLPTGSPAMIMRDVLKKASDELDAECYSFYGNWKNTSSKYMESRRFGFRIENYLNYFIFKITGIHNVGSVLGTISLLHKIKKINPDVIHIHNIHLYVINTPLLFRYIKKNNIRTIWTLHDCWAFTGQCVHFSFENCNKWEKGCYSCKRINAYPSSNIDSTRVMWKLKKKWFSNINDLTLTTPSLWLKHLVARSFMKQYPVVTINNGIDLDVFFPRENNIRSAFSIKRQFILLGVAYEWGKKKGLDVFIELSKKLDNRFQIVLVGINNEVKKKIPKNIICIQRTLNQAKLAEIYTAADLFVNPTREEVLGLVNIESLACGTPVITFKTGGSPECIDNKCGSIIEVDDIDAMIKNIVYICEKQPYKEEDCIRRSQLFNKNDKYMDYIELYSKT